MFGGPQQFMMELGIDYVKRFPHTDQGLPYLDSYISITEKHAKHDVVMLTSDHLIVLADFERALQKVMARFPGPFAMMGQRWDVDVNGAIDFKDPKWQHKLTHKLGHYRGHAAKDWFVFRLPLHMKMLKFAIGRRGWDTWFAHKLLTSGMPVVDVTCVATTIHPIHDYKHVKGGVRREDSTDQGTLYNLKVHSGIVPSPKHISDCNWGLTADGEFLHGEEWAQWKIDKERQWRAEYELLSKMPWQPLKRTKYAELSRPHYCGWNCKWREQ